MSLDTDIQLAVMAFISFVVPHVQSEFEDLTGFSLYTCNIQIQITVSYSGAQFEGDLGEILVLGADISPYIGLRKKWESLFFF